MMLWKKLTVTALGLALGVTLLVPGLVSSSVSSAQTKKSSSAREVRNIPNQPGSVGKVYQPTQRQIKMAGEVNVSHAAAQEALEPSTAEGPLEIRPIHAPKGLPEGFEADPVSIPNGLVETAMANLADPLAPLPSDQGPSPGPSKTFQGEFLSGGSIPPDTMGAVGPSHVVSVSNNQMNYRNRDGVLITRLTLNAFWAGVTLEGGITTPSTFDPKVYYDRFNDKYFIFTSANSLSPASSVLFAVTNTNDPTGTWTRYVFDADPAATGGSGGAGRWADYPTIGFNKNHIVANYNDFNYTCTVATTPVCSTISYAGPTIYVIDKQAAYANTLSTVSTFQDFNCGTPQQTDLGCGFTMAPSVAEDNTTEVTYLLENWNGTSGQLRMSKITGTPSAPLITVGTQFPQSPFSWRTNAARIGTSGGYVPQRQQIAYAVSGTRIMANDARINNTVLRNGSLWASHHVMVGAAPTPAGTGYGTTNPDIRAAVQWWEIDPTIEDNVNSTAPIQRARIEDPNADNCNSGSSTGNSTERAACVQQGQHFIFAGISVNKDDDVLIGFTQGSPLTYPSAAYAMRRAADPPNTMRDVVVYRSGASSYNLGSGSGTARQNRWGDYSASQTDPVNDTDFWTVQEYSGTRTNFGIGIAAPWATWWALVSPTSTQPSNAGNLIISEFRLRGPQGVNDEFVELYNPSTTTPLRVVSADNSEGWALATNNGVTTTGLTVVPQGVVIPPRGHYLIANSPIDNAGGETTNYGLNAHPGAAGRTATADTGYSVDIPDNTGVALFKSSLAAAFLPANQADAVGFDGALNTTFREGTGIPAITAGAVTGQISFYRDLSSGTHKDTQDNAADFIFVNTLADTETLGSTPRIGAPGPENVDAPIQRNESFKASPVDNYCTGGGPASSACGRVRSAAGANPTNAAFGTLAIRRRFTNRTGAPVTRLRFRVVDLTTGPAPVAPGTADLRALSSTDIAEATLANGGTTLIRGLTLEEPPTQAAGGGYNSTLSAGFITLAQPLAPDASVNVEFLTGVMQSGTFRFLLNLEALTAPVAVVVEEPAAMKSRGGKAAGRKR